MKISATRSSVDNLRIQDALNFTPRLLESPLWPWFPYYQLPYHFMQPSKVLILGAGAGNEALVALMYGAKEVHVVEIDPVIASLGEFRMCTLICRTGTSE